MGIFMKRIQIIITKRDAGTGVKETPIDVRSLDHLFSNPKSTLASTVDMIRLGEKIQREIEETITKIICNVDGVDTVSVYVTGEVFDHSSPGAEDTKRIAMVAPEMSHWEWEDDFQDYFL